jgi:hypothetical protein
LLLLLFGKRSGYCDGEDRRREREREKEDEGDACEGKKLGRKRGMNMGMRMMSVRERGGKYGRRL